MDNRLISPIPVEDMGESASKSAQAIVSFELFHMLAHGRRVTTERYAGRHIFQRVL
jgi:hypothetical protein